MKKLFSKRNIVQFFDLLKEVLEEFGYSYLEDMQSERLDFVVRDRKPNWVSMTLDAQKNELLVQVVQYAFQRESRTTLYKTQEVLESMGCTMGYGYGAYTYQDGVVHIPLEYLVFDWEHIASQYEDVKTLILSIERAIGVSAKKC